MYVNLVVLDSLTSVIVVGVLVSSVVVHVHALVGAIELAQLRRPTLGKEIFIFFVLRFRSLLLSSFAKSHAPIISCIARELLLHRIWLLLRTPSILRASVQGHSQRITSITFCRV